MEFKNNALARIERLNKTTVGALLAAILAVLFLISRYVPVIGTIAIFFCPVPLVLNHVKFGDIRHSALVSLVSTALVGILAGPFAAFIFFVCVGLQGLTLGYSIEARKSALDSIFRCALVTTASTLLFIFVLAPMTGMNISFKRQLEIMSETFAKAGEQNIEALKKSGANEEQVKSAEAFYKQTVEAVKGMHVFALVAFFGSALLSAFVNYTAAYSVLKRLSYDISPVPAFELWRMPWGYLWVFIAGLVTIMYTDGSKDATPGYYLNVVGRNINYAFFILFVLNGLSITHFYFKQYSLNMALRVFFYFLIFFHPLFYMFVLVMGLIDPWMDVRKLDSENTPKEGGFEQ